MYRAKATQLVWLAHTSLKHNLIYHMLSHDFATFVDIKANKHQCTILVKEVDLYLWILKPPNNLHKGSWPLRKSRLILSPSVLWPSWGVPLAITIAAVCLNKIGYDASEVSVGWCWVRIQAPDRVLWMLLTGKIWEFLAYLTLPVLYILIKRHIHIAVSVPVSCKISVQCSYAPNANKWTVE